MFQGPAQAFLAPHQSEGESVLFKDSTGYVFAGRGQRATPPGMCSGLQGEWASIRRRSECQMRCPQWA